VDHQARQSKVSSDDGDTTKKDACYLEKLQAMNQANALRTHNQEQFREEGYESMDSPGEAVVKLRKIKRQAVDYSLLFKERHMLERINQMSKTSQIKFLFENLVDLKEQVEQAEEQKDRNFRIVEKFESELQVANNDSINLQNQIKDREQTIHRLENQI
jgi:hypothetical protein